MKEPKSPVIFRRWNKKHGGAVLALFPNEACSATSPFLCQSYEHVGQHGGADLRGVMLATKPATRAEAKPLRDELARIGYNLKVITRIPQNSLKIRREMIAEFNA